MTKQQIIIGWTKVPEKNEKTGEKASRASECGQELLRLLLRNEFGIELSGERESISREEGGKPFLVGHPGIHFNISHSGDYAVCAVGAVPLGIDIQYHKKGDHRKLGRRVMTEEEWGKYESLGFRDEFFFRCWTRKESYLKYTGEGIRRDLRTLVYERCRFWECRLWKEYTGMLCVPDEWEGDIIIREIKEVKTAGDEK